MFKILNQKNCITLQVAKQDFYEYHKMTWDEAKKSCSELGKGWRLPTIEELNLIYDQLHKSGLGGFKDDETQSYWSNSEVDSESSLVFNFSRGNTESLNKNTKKFVRAVRDYTYEDIEEIKIGDQIWMTKNLDAYTFRNGDFIQNASSPKEWRQCIEQGIPAWCYYDNSKENGNKVGKLYNWHAVADQRGLAPKDWHIPSDEEWLRLVDNLGGPDFAGLKMKSSLGWYSNNGTNESGFSALPSGWRFDFKHFYSFDAVAYYWSSKKFSSGEIFHIGLTSSGHKVDLTSCLLKDGDGFSIRCIKD